MEIRCWNCDTSHQTDTGEVKALLFCGNCGELIQGVENDLWGPGNRPAEDDARIFGTDEEKEDAEYLRDSELAAEPSAKRARSAREESGAFVPLDDDEEFERQRQIAIEQLEERTRQLREKEEK